ncbi:MAG: LysR family transcriptional regulator [Alphaproteobacteria bacterium]|nr:LysR family transcriptional regulator [Alphaproteobacteria bacterium]
MTHRLPHLNGLRAFEAAARHLSFKTAASELGVTAGAVSQQVRKLEETLDVPLFRRLPQGLLLTDAGERYLPSITRAFEDLTRATEAIAPDINAKKFNIGVSSEARLVLPQEWPKRDKRLTAYVRSVIETNDIDLVRTDEVDCLIRFGDGPYGDLAVIAMPLVKAAAAQPAELHFVCKPGLADCRQSKAILESLDDGLSPSG